MRRTRIEHILSANIAHKMACKCCQGINTCCSIWGETRQAAQAVAAYALAVAGHWTGTGTGRFVALRRAPRKSLIRRSVLVGAPGLEPGTR
jgi:hypothetical protein